MTFWHIEIDGKSWCQLNVGADIALGAPRRMALVCQHHNQDAAAKMVTYLRGRGLNAQVVDGPCQQRDDDVPF